LQSCQGVACQTRLRWMWCQNCMEDVKTGHSQRRTSKTCKSYVRWQKSHTWLFFGYFGIWLQSWGSVWLQKQQGRKWLRKLFTVCDCKIYWFISVTAKKEKENWTNVWLQLFGMSDCKKETWFCLCGWKATWLFGIWLQAWVVCDCKKLKCLIAKSAGLFRWLQKRKRKLNQCVIATNLREWLQPGIMCGCKKKKPDFVCVVEKLLGCLEYDCKPGYCVIAKN
jgi:hypothetical protein